MSTLAGEQESRVLTSEEELYGYFQKFSKPASKQRVGIECEFFGVEQETGKALLYFGPRGIEAILCRLAAVFHYEPVLEEGHVIALRKGENWITLEPGGQVELSAPPVATIFEVEKQIQNFAAELHEIEKYFSGIAWLSVGLHPFSSLEDIPWVPKHRYEIMKSYLGKKGRLAHEMMKLTATNQANFDYPDEATALVQFRVIHGITSFVSAVFAHSAFSSGRPNGYLGRRLAIWNETDPDRCGVLTEFIKEGKTFRDYVKYLLGMPLMFVVRGGKWIPMEGIPFREFVREGKGEFRATLADFELHLSTAFPEARFKQYIEVRGVDAQQLPLIPAVAAFWKGILYDAEVREEAWKLVRGFRPEERLRLHQTIPKGGLKARIGSVSVCEIAQELFRLSCKGLGKQAKRGQVADDKAASRPVPFSEGAASEEGKNECVYLERIEEKIIAPCRSPAETLLEKWEGEFQRDPQRLIRYLEI